MRRKQVLVVVLVGVVLLAGCSAGGGAGSANDAPSDVVAEKEAAAAATGTPAPEATASGDGDASAARRTDRAIVRTGRVELTVDSFETTSDRIRTLARESGGYVAETSRQTRGEENRTWTAGVVTVRVPSERFNETFDTIQTLGTVREASADTRDVTDQLVDIEARLRTLRAERARLRELYEGANDTEAVLRVSERLSEVQTEIERLEARKRSLERRVAYSTITVQLREERPTPTPEPGYTDTSLGAAFAASVDGVVTVVQAATVTVAYALPYVLAFGLPLGVLGIALARRR
ncbi:DUF4349 domain-containing protein [Halosegnis sp.]|uniref:DUF4349 domain-containing protein n=1 Tax=Halosegnis sp. TaxID=2864959 RepID=UPI0035D45136